jgi:Tol biopolymer transport system component
MRAKATVAPLAVATCVGAGVLSGLGAQSTEGVAPNHALVDKIVVFSDRHDPTLPPQTNNFEIYLLNLDGSGEQRLTHNNVGDGFGTLSPDGKKLVFDSTRNLVEGEPGNTSDLFVMDADGSNQTFLTRGGSPTWSPDSKYVAFHASASGTGRPINNLPGAATEDSDIFVVNVDDLLERGTPPRNLTNDPDHVDDDPDWSPDGNSIAYTSHDVDQRPVPPMPLNYTTAEVYLRAADGSGTPIRLTANAEEERAANWSHQGDRIAYMCHAGSPIFQFCVTDVNGNWTQITNNGLPHLGGAWSPDDQRIFFNRPTPGRGNQIWWVAADGTAEQLLVPAGEPTGSTLGPDVGVLQVKTAN